MDYRPDNTPAYTVPGNGNAQPPMGTCPPYGATPGVIYENNHVTGVPQYHYGAPANQFGSTQYIEEQRARALRRKRDKKRIRSLGTAIGATLIAYIICGNILPVLFVFLIPDFYNLYTASPAMASAYGIFHSVVNICIPFTVFSLFYKKDNLNSAKNFSFPKDKFKTTLLILIGFLGCLASNYAVTIMQVIAEGFGITADYTALSDPGSTLDVILVYVSVAVIPPLIEEFAFRGILLNSLKKYGNGFAIICSALFFGIMHANPVQIPFAFLCGLFLGYVAIATGSIWPSVIIHALSNGLSATVDAVTYYFDENIAEDVYVILFVTGIVLGIGSLIFYIVNYFKKDAVFDTDKTAQRDTVSLTTGGKYAAILSSPVMIIAIIICFKLAYDYLIFEKVF